MIFDISAVISIYEENNGKCIFGYGWSQNAKYNIFDTKYLELASRAKNVAIFTFGAETAFSRAMYHERFFLRNSKMQLITDIFIFVNCYKHLKGWRWKWLKNI